MKYKTKKTVNSVAFIVLLIIIASMFTSCGVKINSSGDVTTEDDTLGCDAIHAMRFAENWLGENYIRANVRMSYDDEVLVKTEMCDSHDTYPQTVTINGYFDLRKPDGIWTEKRPYKMILLRTNGFTSCSYTVHGFEIDATASTEATE